MNSFEGGADAGRIAVFAGWMWDPRTTMRVRGLPTADLYVYPRLLQVLPRPIGARLGHLTPVSYAWPAVVVEYVNWSWRWNWPGAPMVLVDVNDALGGVAVSRGNRRQLLAALTQAGFLVGQVKKKGWEEPASVTRADFADLADRLPASVLAANRWTMPTRRI